MWRRPRNRRGVDMTHVMATGNQHLNVQAEGGSSGVEILTFRHQACFFTFPLVWSAFVISTAIRTALKEAWILEKEGQNQRTKEQFLVGTKCKICVTQ